MTTTTRYTPEDLLQMPDAGSMELVDGQLVEKKMSGLSSMVAIKLAQLIMNFIGDSNLGFVFGADCGYQCFLNEPDKVRKPDVSYISKGRITIDQLERGHLKINPDLAVEVISPNDLYSEIENKIEEYLGAGVQLVWVIEPESRTVQIHRPDGSDSRIHEDDTLSGESVLADFSCTVSELFPTT